MIAQALKTNRAKVYITDRREEALDKVVKQYESCNGSGKIIALPGNVSKKEECIRLAKEVDSKETNGIHLLVNNAGMHATTTGSSQPLANLISRLPRAFLSIC